MNAIEKYTNDKFIRLLNSFLKKICEPSFKKEYGEQLNDYFKMTYDGMDFVSFHVQSFIFPPEKTNEDKFFEVFGVTEK